MVVTRRLLLAIASTLALTLGASAPAMASSREAEPQPLRTEGLLRVKDIAAGPTRKGPVVAVGWHESSQPGRLNVTFSLDGGTDYRRTNGNLRQYPIVGTPERGMSLAVCSGRVWVGSVYEDPDGAGSRVLMTSRTVGGGAAQQFISPLDGRKVRNVSIACAGNKLLAIGWLETRNRDKRARLVLRSMEPLGEQPAFQRAFKFGPVDIKGGFEIAATPSAVLAAYVRRGNLLLKQFLLDGGDGTSVRFGPPSVLARRDVKGPRLAARRQRVVVAYSDAGKVKARLSRDLGTSFERPQRLVRSGSKANPSTVYSADVVGDRVVVEIGANEAGVVTPQLVDSTDGGQRWRSSAFGHIGARVGALLKAKGQTPRLMEAWHNNAPPEQADTLRARYEVP